MMGNWKELPTGDTKQVKAVIAAEWKAPDRETQSMAVYEFKERFQKKYLNEVSNAGLKNYSCFLNQDGEHIFHFSEWADALTVESFICKDWLLSASQLQDKLTITSLWKNLYYPFKSHKVTGKSIENTTLIVFVKQYFQKPDQAKEWVDMILETLRKEGNHEGFIQNTYYLNQYGTALLNYALWENEMSYDIFLKHIFPQTKKNWEAIEKFEGWISKKGVVKRHKEFINLFNQMKVGPS
jgi:hypothetical protein